MKQTCQYVEQIDMGRIEDIKETLFYFLCQIMSKNVNQII